MKTWNVWSHSYEESTINKQNKMKTPIDTEKMGGCQKEKTYGTQDRWKKSRGMYLLLYNK